VPSAYEGVATRWATPDRPPVERVPELSPANTRGSALVYSRLRQDLRPPRGPRALMQHGAEHSQAVDPRPLACAPDSPAPPRRSPGPLPERPRPAARHLRDRRGDHGRPTGGGASARRRRARCRVGVPPGAHDGTERRIVRPQAPAEQTTW